MITFEALHDARVGFQAAVAEVVEIVHHVRIGLQKDRTVRSIEAGAFRISHDHQSTHFVNFGFTGLFQRHQHRLEVVAEVTADGQGEVTEYRDDLWLQVFVHGLVLQRQENTV